MPLRVTHYSFDDVTGGAARCAFRLHEGLRRLGHRSNMVVRRRRSSDADVLAYRPPGGMAPRLARRAATKRIDRALRPYRSTMPEETEAFSDDRAPFGADPVRMAEGSDIVNLHWVSGFLALRENLARLTSVLPVVWTLHDMNLFTGGCHYDRGCDAWKSVCGACPQLGSSVRHDLSEEIWRRKKSALDKVEHRSLHIVSPSRWLAEQVRESSLVGDRFPVTVIPYGLDTEVLRPRGREVARAALGLPSTGTILLFVAQTVTNPRKGFELLAAAAEALPIEDLTLLSIGAGRPEVPSSSRHIHLGHTSDERLLSVVYSAADAFVIPTRQDNLPATVLESLACGTPVAGFDVGGVPEMVRPGVTGELAPAEDVEGLTAAILRVVDPQANHRLAEGARRTAEEEFNPRLQAERYESLYVSMGAEGV